MSKYTHAWVVPLYLIITFAYVSNMLKIYTDNCTYINFAVQLRNLSIIKII